MFVLEILLYGRLGLLCFSVHLGCLIIILAACTGAPSFPSTVCLCCLCAQIGARLTDGRTVLHLAAMYGQSGIASLLVAKNKENKAKADEAAAAAPAPKKPARRRGRRGEDEDEEVCVCVAAFVCVRICVPSVSWWYVSLSQRPRV